MKTNVPIPLSLVLWTLTVLPALGADPNGAGVDPWTAWAAQRQNAQPFAIDETQYREAMNLLYSRQEVTVVTPNPDPGAQWFRQASLGLFLHWGIHSVGEYDPSWAMIRNYFKKGSFDMCTPQEYYGLARRFNPHHYDPDQWAQAAKKAGFSYIVLTTKHHDGYALWPSRYGDMNTRHYLGGRDLLQPFVAACRRAGLKVGFYFSPRDWYYPGFPMSDVGFDRTQRGKYPPIQNLRQNRKRFELFFAYTIGQLRELLTRYGRIDILFFDGLSWPGIDDLRAKQVFAWIRRLQPQIVINDRWGSQGPRLGDFETPEGGFPRQRPAGWWENCVRIRGHWGYNESRWPCWPTAQILERLIKICAWGGSFLPDVGPAPDGTMPPDFYQRCDELAAWMKCNGEAVLGADPTPGDQYSNVPLTRRGQAWYLHILANQQGPVELHGVPDPHRIVLLAEDKTLDYSYDGQNVSIHLPAAQPNDLPRVLKIVWDKQPRVN